MAGPTAVGKTAHAIEVARHFNTVILSADSRQCFKEMNIGVARPSVEELSQVAHYFIASHSIGEDINAAWYERYALNLLNGLFLKYDTVVVTGGTGLYIKALTEGLDAIPEVATHIRTQVVSAYEAKGISWLQEQLRQHDPFFSKTGEMQNPQRMMRALEVILGTGQSITSFRNSAKQPRPFETILIGLELSRETLYERINLRVDGMMQAGQEEEARSLLPYRHLNALQTVGYRELFDYFDGTISREEAIEQIKQNTRRYAKRQMTWFKRQAKMHWVDAEEGKIIPLVERLMEKLVGNSK
ncbi:tRNA (adenosine(37)-N6)-dimethylallyltransferase MiaA [Niabella yanshanensis]|uniref:tRNA (adenosine(37)-N6)-dimethylallyltransferase MiaA n=1 Tax=Niabella yanshanensis TaxID=577386 RepID=UPI0021CF78F9|nr:tRNA (adenosine(37)-N6)-dimethylallyltransferase MiaA [Niabella yanshanensis]